MFPGKLYNKAVQVFGSVETNSTVRTNCFTFEREIQNDIYHLYATFFTHLTIEVEKSTCISELILQGIVPLYGPLRKYRR